MKTVHVVIACFIFFMLQMLLSPRIAFGEIAPDFPLLLVAYFAINRTPQQGTMAGFFVGLLQDLYNPELLGINALTKSVSGFALSVAGSKVESDNLFFLTALFGSAALAHDFLYLLFFTGLHLGKFFILFVTVSIPSAIYTALVGVVVHKAAALLGSKMVRTFGKARS